MSRRSIFSLILPVVVTVCIASAEHGAGAQVTGNGSSASVVISLLPVSIVDDQVALLSDVASIECRNQDLRSRIESLDIADASQFPDSSVITPSLVEFRLRLAGIDVRRVTIHGREGRIRFREASVDKLSSRRSSSRDVLQARASIPAEAKHVSTAIGDGKRELMLGTSKGVSIQTDEYERRSCEEIVICAARRCVLGQLPWDEDHIKISLVQPLSRDVQSMDSAKSAVFTAELHSPGPPMGRVQIEVRIEGLDDAATVVPVLLDVRHFDNVVATAKAIPRGRELQLEDLYIHRSDVTGSADYCSDPQRLVGKVARRALPALQIVRDQDLESTVDGTRQSASYVVKRQDRVKMIARIGDLNITVSGQAQQDGRIGELIRVQNLESKAIVQGRVLGPNEVEISE